MMVSSELWAAFARAVGRSEGGPIASDDLGALMPEHLFIALAHESPRVRRELAFKYRDPSVCEAELLYLIDGNDAQLLQAESPIVFRDQHDVAQRLHDEYIKSRVAQRKASLDMLAWDSQVVGADTYVKDAARDPRGGLPLDSPHLLRAFKSSPTSLIARWLGINIEQPTGELAEEQGLSPERPEPDPEDLGGSRLVGTVLGGQYRLISPLGVGSFGRVFRADDTVLGRAVAVKVLHRHLSEDPGYLRQFLREARTLAKMSHPNVAMIFDRGGHDWTYFIVSQWSDMGDVRHLLQREHMLAPRRVVHLATEVAAGLAHAHQLGIVHCDVKPSNILLVDDGPQSPPRVLVNDFGIAASAIVTGRAAGTFPYMAPEQAASSASNPSFDVFGLGATCLHLLLGALPRRTADGAFEMPVTTGQLGSYMRVLDRATSADPRQRHQTVEALAQDLQEIDANAPEEL